MSARAHVVVLGLAATIAALVTPACEVVSGLDGLDPVDCLICDAAVRGDSSSDSAALDGSADGPSDGSGLDAAEPDALDPDAGEVDGASCEVDPDCGPAACSMHENGTGQDFVDCVPRGTYDATEAMEACVAYTGNSSQCSAATCGATSVVCSGGAASGCACWGFAGAGSGHVESSGEPGTLNCMCPGPTTPTWN